MDVKVDVKITIMKALHAKWLSEFYNYINSSDGQEITCNGWLRAGITDAIKMRSSKLPSLDHFLDICSDIDFVINENPSQAEFTNFRVPRILIQSLILIGKKKTPTTMEMQWTFLKIKRHPQHFVVLLIFDICFICFLSSYFFFLKIIQKLQF